MMKVDVTILGGGPGGFAAALKAREYGFKALLIEKEAVGGVCLHRGCIPTKSLLADAFLLRKEKREDKKNAFSEMLSKKEKVVSRIHQGALDTLKKEGVLLIQGEAKVVREHLVRVNDETIETKFILIATGSRPKEITGFPFDGERILSSDDLLKIKDIPQSLLIIGAGPTGCEFASLFHVLGTQVFLLEVAPSILPGQDEEISEALKKIFIKQGIEVHAGETVVSVQKRDEGVVVSTASGEKKSAEKILVSIGRSPNSQNLGLESLEFSLINGVIPVDACLRTVVPSIYAVGDVTGKWPLAHVASHQGRIAIENIAGKKRSAEEMAIPECVFTMPEIAKVGWTEKEAKGKGKEIRVGRSSFFVSAKAQILEEKEGFVKLVGEAQTGKLLGAHLLGPQVTELLGELTLALRMEISVSEIQETIHPHPTLSESVEEAARDFVQKGKQRDNHTFSGMASKAN